MNVAELIAELTDLVAADPARAITEVRVGVTIYDDEGEGWRTKFRVESVSRDGAGLRIET